MKKIFLIFLFPFFCFASSVGEDNNQFAFSLFSQFEEEENLAFSPYGIFSNLSVLYFGAEDATAQEIKNTLHLSETGEKFLTAFQKHRRGLSKEVEHGYQLSIANALFPHQGTHFLTQFKEITAKYFDAKLQALDYEVPDSALETINTWIEENTKGRIKGLVTEADIDKATRLVVANAVYFQGEWVFPFRTTQEKPFYTSSHEKVEVETLLKTQSFPYYENDEVQCLALPFVRHGSTQPFLECLLILPKQVPLSQVAKDLTPKKFDQILYNLEPTGVHVEIPKFCFSKKLLLNPFLKQLGMQDAFTYQANFSKMDGMRDLFLNKVLHETYFSFDEKGVTAASATTSSIGVTSVPPVLEETVDFIANHPFLFFIVDYHSRAILFMGHVYDPTSEGCHAI